MGFTFKNLPVIGNIKKRILPLKRVKSAQWSKKKKKHPFLMFKSALVSLQACDLGTFKKPELIESPAGPITVGTERKIWFLHPQDQWKMQIQELKYSIINKSTTFAPFCNPHINLLTFALFLHKSQQLIIFSEKLEFW